MKRFFFTFSVILVVTMLVMAGAFAALHAGAIWTETKDPNFVGGWNVTQIPYQGIFPGGGLNIVRQAGAADVKPGDVVLFSGGSDWFMKAGLVGAVSADTVRLTTADGVTADEPAASVKAVYRKRIPRLGWLMEEIKSPAVIGVFMLVLIASILLWRRLPGSDRKSQALSPSDGEIATILY